MWEDGRLGAVWGLQRLAHVIYFTEMVNVVVQISFPQTPFTSRASWGCSGPPGAVRGLPRGPETGLARGVRSGFSLEAKTEENTSCLPLAPSGGALPGRFRGLPGVVPGSAAKHRRDTGWRRRAPGSARERRGAPQSSEQRRGARPLLEAKSNRSAQPTTGQGAPGAPPGRLREARDGIGTAPGGTAPRTAREAPEQPPGAYGEQEEAGRGLAWR